LISAFCPVVRIAGQRGGVINAAGEISKGISIMHFVKHLRPARIKPSPGKLPPLIKRIWDNWLFALGAGMLGLGVLCGLW
jgi:hypothetical protein